MTLPCKLFVGFINPDGYGMKWYRTAPRRAHVVAWLSKYGDDSIPLGYQINHTCDNRACIQDGDEGVYEVNGGQRKRLGHLWLGTHQDNMDDMDAKGRRRSVFGMQHSNAKLTDANVLDIRRRYAAGERQVALGREFGVRQTLISMIVNHRIWRHLP